MNDEQPALPRCPHDNWPPAMCPLCNPDVDADALLANQQLANPVKEVVLESVLEKIVRQIFLRCPISGGSVRLISLRGAESKLDHIELTVESDAATWRHKIFTEEM